VTHSDWLQTLAEIAIGFAGFAALIAGMRRRDGPIDLENAGRGRAVVETSLSVLFGCTIPVLLHGLGISEESAFRIAGSLFLLVGAPLTVRGFRRASAARPTAASVDPVLGSLSIVAGLGSVSFSLACVVGVPGSSVPTYFLGALVGTLGIAAINFTSFVFAIVDE